MENNNSTENNPSPGPQKRQPVTAQQIEDIKAVMKDEQNLSLGIKASAVAALAGAVIWALISMTFNFQITYMAMGVGLLVGAVNRLTGKGFTPQFGVVGAVFSFIGCFAGNYLVVVAVNSNNFFPALFSIPPSRVLAVLMAELERFDVIFYAAAATCGYLISIRKVTEEDLEKYEEKVKTYKEKGLI